MAEIPIQHKPRKRTSAWPLVIGALLILLLVWGVTLYRRGNTNTAAVPADTATAAGEVSRPLDTAARTTPFDTTRRP